MKKKSPIWTSQFMTLTPDNKINMMHVIRQILLLLSMYID